MTQIDVIMIWRFDQMLMIQKLKEPNERVLSLKFTGLKAPISINTCNLSMTTQILCLIEILEF